MVSGEAIDSVIEAAHITPYDGLKTNTLDNGLLLRVDIHRLFDKGLCTTTA
jgi:putative restriction endonuclease